MKKLILEPDSSRHNRAIFLVPFIERKSADLKDHAVTLFAPSIFFLWKVTKKLMKFLGFLHDLIFGSHKKDS